MGTLAPRVFIDTRADPERCPKRVREYQARNSVTRSVSPHRVTLFRAWYSRTRFGHLSGSARVSMNTLGARVPIGGLYGDITYPVTSPLAITMGFAVNEAAHGNFADAMDALDDVQAGPSEHLLAWVKAVVYGAAGRWTDVIEQVRAAGNWPDAFLAGAAGVAHGVAAVNLGLFTDGERRLTEANASPAAEAVSYTHLTLPTNREV